MFRREDLRTVRRPPDVDKSDRMVRSITCSLGKAELCDTDASVSSNTWRMPIRVEQYKKWQVEQGQLKKLLSHLSANATIQFDEASATIWLRLPGKGRAAATACAGHFLYVVSVQYLLDLSAENQTAS